MSGIVPKLDLELVLAIELDLNNLLMMHTKPNMLYARLKRFTFLVCLDSSPAHALRSCLSWDLLFGPRLTVWLEERRTEDRRLRNADRI